MKGRRVAMKKLMLSAFVLVTSACGVFAPLRVIATATETPFVVPNLMATPVVTTPTPIIVSPTPTPTPTVYVVQQGDTLAKIAGKFGLNVNDLSRINKLTDPNWIFPGDVLILEGKLIAPDEVAPVPVPDIADGKEIIVVIHDQRVHAFENGVYLKTFVVSTGIAEYPTVIGHYKIYVKLRYTEMIGPGYDLTNVPYTMYFYQGYGLHGTYWHHNFGVPMSHGCVNMRSDPVDDAAWLYNWAEVGTTVWVIP